MEQQAFPDIDNDNAYIDNHRIYFKSIIFRVSYINKNDIIDSFMELVHYLKTSLE